MQKHTSHPHSLIVPQSFARPEDYPEARFSFGDQPVKQAEYAETLLAALPSQATSQGMIKAMIAAGGIGALLSTLLTFTRP